MRGRVLFGDRLPVLADNDLIPFLVDNAGPCLVTCLELYLALKSGNLLFVKEVAILIAVFYTLLLLKDFLPSNYGRRTADASLRIGILSYFSGGDLWGGLLGLDGFSRSRLGSTRTG